MNRRTFLGKSTLATSAIALSGLSLKPARASQANDWETIRGEFNIHPDWVNMAAFYLSSHPRPVREAIEQHRRLLDDCTFIDVEDNMGKYETTARQAVVSYFGGKPDDYAMTGSTTMGLGTVYGGLKLKAPHEVLTTTHDHPSTVASLRFASQRAGFGVRNISLYPDGAQASSDEITETFRKNIRPETRLLAITWVHSSTGVKLPISRISAMVKEINSQRAAGDKVILAVDGVHGFGVENTTIEELGCDLFMSGCHKWIFGPRGTGLVYGTPLGWSLTSPILPSFDSIWRGYATTVKTPAAMMTPGGFHAFEHAWALPAAFQMHLTIGKQKIHERTLKLNRELKDGLLTMRKVTLHTPLSDDLSSGIVCFDIAGINSKEVVARLRSMNIIASETPYDPSYARLSASLLNSDADIEKTVAAIHSLI